jgi:hypothetical protein
MSGRPHDFEPVGGSQFLECKHCKVQVWAYGPLSGDVCPKAPPESGATMLDRALARGFGFGAVDRKFKGGEP